MPPSLSLRALLALTVAFIAAVFVFDGVYVTTQHNPVPHQLRVGVAGSQNAIMQVTAGLNLAAPGYFKVYTYPSAAAMKTAIKDRKIYGGYVETSKKTGLLLTAGAAGEAPQLALELVAQGLAKNAGVTVTSQDVVPLPTSDSHGLSSYTYQYGLLVPAFVFGVLLFMFAHGLTLARRLGLAVVYAIGAGILGTLTVDQIVGALPGHFLALTGLATLYSAMAVLVTFGLSRLLGYAGTVLAGLALILVGNSTGGGSINQEFLPNVFRDFGQVLPNGAFIRSVRDTVYFSANNIGQSTIVVALWTVGGLVLALAADPVRALVARPKRSKTVLEAAS
jgi:hypothetical protein